MTACICMSIRFYIAGVLMFNNNVYVVRASFRLCFYILDCKWIAIIDVLMSWFAVISCGVTVMEVDLCLC